MGEAKFASFTLPSYMWIYSTPGRYAFMKPSAIAMVAGVVCTNPTFFVLMINPSFHDR